MIFINLLANNVTNENKIAVAVAVLHDTMIFFKYTYRLDALSHICFYAESDPDGFLNG